MTKQNTPFIVRVRRANQPCCITGKPLVVAEGTKVGTWGAEWMDAENFPMKETQQEAYFICTKKGSKLRVHKEVYRKGERLAQDNKPFILNVVRVNAPYITALNPLVMAGSRDSGTYPTQWLDASQVPMQPYQKFGFFICTIKDGKLRVHKEVRRRKGEIYD